VELMMDNGSRIFVMDTGFLNTTMEKVMTEIMLKERNKVRVRRLM